MVDPPIVNRVPGGASFLTRDRTALDRRSQAERLQLEEILQDTASPEDETTPPRMSAPVSPVSSFPIKAFDPPTPKQTVSLPKIGETPLWNDPGNTPPPKQRPPTISEGKKEY